ncbi:Zn(2)-Cys(6) binuclear cluster domain-containing protein [Mycena leptocephala]|nr:Zn(2)-Cys(6) binuclear cluster domain-containing protein [Mycena leptocephala]
MPEDSLSHFIPRFVDAKCDAVRPKCGPCSRSPNFEDREYPAGGPTRTQILEEQIAFVEARIEELEKPQELRLTLPLHRPYTDERRSPSHQALSRGSSSHLIQFFSLGRRVLWIHFKTLPPIDLEPLINNFLSHSSQFGFFLNVHRFQEALRGGGGGRRPAAVLLDAVHLWAVHLSGSPDLTTHETIYLSRALSTAAAALPGSHPLHSIQAAVLLSSYFFRNTRFLEGKYHLGVAVGLVIGAGMHRIRSVHTNAGGRTLTLAPAPAREEMEEERIAAFWSVLTLNNCWTTADGSPSNISYGANNANADANAHVRIDTPWPLDINSPHFPNQFQGLGNTSMGMATVTAFLAGQPDNGTSMAALHAKAAILFEQAASLAGRYRPQINADQLTQFYLSFNSLDVLLEGFKPRIPTVPVSVHHDQNLNSMRDLLVIHSLAHVATIQLHNPFVGDVDASRVRALDAARAVVARLAQMPVREFGYINPIMGTLLMATCQVFLAELARVRRRHRSLNAINSNIPQEERALREAINTVLGVMGVFARACRLMDSQLRAMQELYH